MQGPYSTREIGPYNARVQGSNFWYIGYVMTNSTDELVARISDAAGNVGSAMQTVSLSVVSNAVYAYDLAGKLTNVQYNGEENLSLQWNEQYQLTAVRANAAGGETGEHIVETYDYDALGRSVKITEGTNVTWLIYDGIHVIAETDDQGNLKKSYVHGPGVDNLLSMTVYNSETNTYTYLKDHLNSTVALADESGHIVETYTYDAWGRVSVFDGAGMPLTESAIGNRYTFQGRAYSWTTDLYYFRARYYDPISGRWLSKDPLGISGGINQYAAFNNSPINYVDPNGESPLGVPLIVAGAFAYVLNAPIPGVGEVVALTVPGTDLTLVGYNYYKLDPHARNIVDAHEAVHSEQGFWDAVLNPRDAELEPYQRQYDLAKDLLENWWDRTKLPAGSDAWHDVNNLFNAADQYLKRNRKGCE